VLTGHDQRFADDVRLSKIRDLLRDAVRVLQVYAEPIRSHALHTYYSAYVTMPHCPLADTLASENLPQVRHALLSPRAAHWSSSGHVLEAGSAVTRVVYAPSRSLIIAGTNSGLLRIWSTVDFEEVAQLSGHKGHITSLAITSDGLRVASGSSDRTIRVWDCRTFEELGLCEHEDEVNSVAFSPDSSLIASGSDDCTVGIWNTRSVEGVTRLTGHTKLVLSVAFFPDGTRIASASFDCTVRMWDARTYEPLASLELSGQVWTITISPDSTRLALGEYTSGTEGVLRVFNAVTLAEQAQVNISPGFYILWAIVFSPDGTLIASGTASGAVQVWDASNLNNISMIKGHHGQVMCIAFSPDGSQMASGSAEGTLRIRPAAYSEEQLAPIPGHDGCVFQVVFSSDGSRLVSGSLDSTVRIWDGLTCEELAVLTGHGNVVWTVDYSPDGSRVISGSDDCTVRVWNALDFQETTVLKGHQDSVRFVTFAPDSTMIASCSDDHTVRLWSLSAELARLEGHRDWVLSVTFSPNGTRLVSVSRDETVRVWDAVNFTQVAELGAHHLEIEAFFPIFSIDGKAILTRLWDHGLSWVCSDDNDSKDCLCIRDARRLTTSS
jgi:WD40 repeat protein